MKKAVSILLLLLLVYSGNSYAQNTQTAKPERMRPALLVIDIQNAFLAMMDKSEKETAMENIRQYMAIFRQKGFPIIRIYHSDLKYGFGPKEGTEPFEFPKTIPIQPEDAKVIKHYPDAFNKTDLDKILKEKKINTVFLCGLSSVGCVLATYIGAGNHDYTAFLVKDALISHKTAYTQSIENIFNALGFEAIDAMLNNAEK